MRGKKKVEQLNLQLLETHRWCVRTISLRRFKEEQTAGSTVALADPLLFDHVAARKTEQQQMELRRSDMIQNQRQDDSEPRR